ncbi:MAG: lysophospholipid acyltransferase family protein [Nitrospirota bacterium]|nr:lysophospholipid acyltransferase family protein [Nitrospirota bacterium]
MESLMDILVGRQANKRVGSIPFSAPTYAQIHGFFGALVRAVYRIEVVGADRLPIIGPVVIAPNHDSVLDGIILRAALSRELRFLAKAELWRSQLLAWMLDGLGAIGIKRGCGDHFALVRMRQALEAGQAVAIFPQGAIYGDRVWHRGAARLALVTGAPLVPVRLVGTARALSRGKIGFPRLRVIFGEPITVARAPEEPVAATKLTERLRAAVESLA